MSEDALTKLVQEMATRKLVEKEVKKLRQNLIDAFEWHKSLTQRSFIELENRVSALEKKN